MVIEVRFTRVCFRKTYPFFYQKIHDTCKTIMRKRKKLLICFVKGNEKKIFMKSVFLAFV